MWAEKQKISVGDIRTNISEVLNEVAYGEKIYSITRHNQDVAIIISAKEWDDIEKFLKQKEDEYDIRMADEALQKIDEEGTISHEDLKRDLGL